jgi:hypothetical protein
VTQVDGREWVEHLRAELPRHAALVDRLLDRLELDERFRALELQCSVARGAGDELSDLDVGFWIADDAWDETVAELPALVRDLEPTIDLLVAELHDAPYLFAQYGSGLQLDALAQPASKARGRVSDAVILLDRDGLLREPYEPSSFRADDAALAEWRFRAWLALANLEKHLRRGSVWEAQEQLQEARSHLLRLHAARAGVPYPGFGLTSLLDAELELPQGLEATTARFESQDVRRAARALAALLDDYDPPPLADWVRRRLGEG